MVDDRLVRYLENPATRQAAARIAASWAHHQDSGRLAKDLDFLEAELAKRQPPEAEVDEERLNAFIRKVNAFDSRFAKFTVPILDAAVNGELEYAEDAFARLEEHVKSIQQGSDTPLQVRWRGEFEAGVQYRPGDLVTKNGSAFVCVKDTESVPSGLSKEWDLLSSVVSGAAGNDGPMGATGPQGPQGPQGPPGAGTAVTFQEVDGVPSGTPDTLIFPNGTLTDNLDGSYTYSPAALGSMTIEEVDGVPTGTPGTLKFPNGSLTDNGDGSFTYTAPASGAIDVTDGSTTVSPATSLSFGAGMVTDSGGGVATISNDHDDLSNVTTDQHHPEVHTIDGTDHIFPTSGDGSTFLDDTGTFSVPPGGLPSWLMTGTTNPQDVVTPSQQGAFYFDTTNGALFVAIGTTDADWVQVGGFNDFTGSQLPGIVEVSDGVFIATGVYKWEFRADSGVQFPPNNRTLFNTAGSPPPDDSLGVDGDIALGVGTLWFRDESTWTALSHDLLSNVSADDHHAQAHAHNGADSSGTVAHSATTGQTANDHHAQSHSDTDHSDGPNAKPGHAHSSHSSIGADDHHAQAHKTEHEPGGGDAMSVDALAATGSLRTLGTGAQQAAAGNDSRLSDARAPTAHHTSHEVGQTDAVAITHAQTTGQTADDHHAQSHSHASHTSIGADDHHAQSHAHSAHTSIGADDHHAQNHNLVDTTGHPVTGLTAGHYLKALTATTYGFAALPAGAITPVVNVYDASTTWSKPTNCTTVMVIAIGGGGGGGSGRKGTGADRFGGGGGGGGNGSFGLFSAATLGTSETVTVGAGNAGGAAISTNSHDGANGTAGGNSYFGGIDSPSVAHWVVGWGGNGGAAGTATSGSGGQNETVDAAGSVTSSFGASFVRSNGGSSSVSATAQTGPSGECGGGGGGGGISSAGTIRNGGNGGRGTGGAGGGSAGGAVPGAGTEGTGGGGGAGGYGYNFLGLGAALAGQDGAIPGGGGGGGGAGTDSAGDSAKGGAGGHGRVVVISW